MRRGSKSGVNSTPYHSEVAQVPETVESLQQEVKRLREQLALKERERIEYLQNVSHQAVAPLNAINCTSRILLRPG